MRAQSPLTDANRLPAGAPAQDPVLSLLSELLIGERAWTMAEVKRLLVVRDLAQLGQWTSSGLDDDGGGAR